jgi:hypothetical protein
MQVWRLIGPTISMAFGLFTLWQGIDSLKIEHLGIRAMTVEWFAGVTRLSYHQAGIGCIVLGVLLLFAGRLRINLRAIPERWAVSAILVAVFLGFLGCGIVDLWFPTHR